jgi:hypothetical protein
VDGLVERAVAAAVETVAGGLAAGCLDGADAGEPGEGGVVAAAAGVGERDDGLSGGDRADAGPAGEVGGQVADDGVPLEKRVLALTWAFPVFRRLARIR